MRECDDDVEVFGLDILTKPSKATKDKAMKDREERIEKLEKMGLRSRIALEEYSKAKMKPGTTVVPFRNDNGAICFGVKLARLGTADLHKAFDYFWKNCRAQKSAAGSRGFNTRNEKYRMSKPLMIDVQEVGRQRFGYNWKTRFEEIIKYICAMDGMDNQLELVEDSSRSQDYVLVRPRFELKKLLF